MIGLIAGWVYLGASALILRLKIDDAVDAIPVHLFGGELRFGPIRTILHGLYLISALPFYVRSLGAWGVISTGLFTNAHRLEVAGASTDNIGWCVYSCFLPKH